MKPTLTSQVISVLYIDKYKAYILLLVRDLPPNHILP